MSEELQTKLRAGYEDLPRRAGALLVGLQPEQCGWRPAPRRWSIAECIEHLIRAVEAYEPRIQDGIKHYKAEPLKARPPAGWLYEVKTRFILSFETPGVVRLPAPPSFKPQTTSGAESPATAELLKCFVDTYGRASGYLDCVEKPEELALISVRNPVIPIFSFTLGQVLLLFLVHARRHFIQIERIKCAAGFPAKERAVG